MALTLDDLIDGLRASRKHFKKHLKGLTPEQWTWKPYPECKSIQETLVHLVIDDRAAVQSLETGKEPDYEGIMNVVIVEAGQDLTKAQAMSEESSEKLCSYIADRFANAEMDSEVCIYGGMRKLAPGLAYLSSEDFYHAGQVAFIRMATDPAWDYYGTVYGPD